MAPPPPVSRAGLALREFRLFQRLIYRESGIHLTDAKRLLVEGRLSRRLRELGMGFREYYALVEGNEAERIVMLDCVSTNETHFFREPRQFEFLETHVWPRFHAAVAAGRRSRCLRVWSAACSTGEEPYSVAMAFFARFPAEAGFQIDILATDISTRVLERARAAEWPIEKAAEIDGRYLRRFMLRGTGSREGWLKAGPELRRVVRFRRLNLHAEDLPREGAYDLIFCRNVLIYFDSEGKARVLDRLLDRLQPEGYLFLGHSETVLGQNPRTRSVGPTVYTHAEAA